MVPVLAKTFGAILYQEQAIQVIAAMTGCTEAEADKVRKSLAKHARMNTMEEVRAGFVRRSLAFHPDFDERRANLLFDMLEGWSGYGFTEGHAASFGLTAYRTAFLSVHYAAEFYSGLLNHQPMGFYTANTLAAEARRRGVQVHPVDINRSEDRSYAEETDAIRLGLRLVSGLREEDIESILAARQERPFVSLLDFCWRITLHRDRLENLILCGAFDSLHTNRRGLMWALDDTLALACSYRAAAVEGAQSALNLGSVAYAATPMSEVEDFSPWDAFLWTWRLTGVCAECHVFAYLRDQLRRHGIMTAYDAQRQKPGTRVTVAGLNIRPHRPPTKSGKPVLFTTVEDETGLLQTVSVEEAIDTCTPVFLLSPAVVVEGTIERRGTGASLKVATARPLRMQDFVSESGLTLPIAPPPVRTYTGTRLREPVGA
jgi:error-prone DNA polymerase